MAQVYALGSNGSGQLAIGHTEDVSVPKEVRVDSPSPLIHINQVKAGGNHTLLLADDKLYAAGDPISGACGVSQPPKNPAEFRPIHLTVAPSGSATSFPVTLCAATWEASIVVQQDDKGKSNQVFSFGTGHRGELGLGELLFRSAKPQLIKDFPPSGCEVRDMAACVSHVVAVLNNGDVYGWGNGRKGQIGEPKGFVYRPRKITVVDFKVSRVVCGREFTCLLGGPEVDNFCILGSDKGGIISLAPIALPRWKDIGAGWNSIHVLDLDGSLKSWGQDNYGQLAPPGLPILSQIAAGSEHTLGLTVDGKVLVWGWGEHGNCGPKASSGGEGKKWNIIASSEYMKSTTKIVGIGAGCATSWVFVESCRQS